MTALVIVAAFLTLSGGKPVNADNTYFPLQPGNPFIQNWSNINLITVDDNWSGVPSINGYRGDDPSGGVGVNPQSILVDMSGVLDVNANRNDPNTFPTGGVIEFDGIPNPVVALQGSAEADFPHIDIRLNTTNCVNPAKLGVWFNVRDLDGSPDDALQQTALHYRVGPTGNYTNIVTGSVFDATNPNTATRVSDVYMGLPADAMGKPQVHVRIMTANAAGNDEVVGIDDIFISCAAPTAATVTMSGRVTSNDGRALARVAVTVTGGSLTEPLRTLTNGFGYYTFEGLAAGETYIVTVGAKQYTFAAPSRVVQLTDSAKDIDFVAEP